MSQGQPQHDPQAVANAKTEYLLRLSKTIGPFVLKFIDDTYSNAIESVGQRNAVKETQKVLRETPMWNAMIIKERTSAIEAKEPALFNLIAATFVSFVKILSSIRISDAKPTMRLKIPATDKFVHRVYVLASRKFYEQPRLLRIIPGDEQILRERWSAVVDAVENAVRDLVPFDDILSVYLSSAVDKDQRVPPVLSPADSEQESDREEEPAADEFDVDDATEFDESVPKMIPPPPPPSYASALPPTQTQEFAPPPSAPVASPEASQPNTQPHTYEPPQPPSLTHQEPEQLQQQLAGMQSQQQLPRPELFRDAPYSFV